MDSKPGARSQADLDIINKLAEPVVRDVSKRVTELLRGILDAGFTEKEAHHFAAYFLVMLAGRSAAFELQAEAYEKRITGFSAMDLLSAIGASQQKAMFNISEGFTQAMVDTFGLDRDLFEKEVKEIMIERATANMPVPPKGSSEWN